MKESENEKEVKKTMLYRSFDDERGYPPRFYRTPSEVKKEILEISRRISEVNERLNIREIISSSENCEKPFSKEMYDRLSELLTFALDTLSELRELEDTLDKLKEEYLEISEILMRR